MCFFVDISSQRNTFGLFLIHNSNAPPDTSTCVRGCVSVCVRAWVDARLVAECPVSGERVCASTDACIYMIPNARGEASDASDVCLCVSVCGCLFVCLCLSLSVCVNGFVCP